MHASDLYAKPIAAAALAFLFVAASQGALAASGAAAAGADITLETVPRHVYKTPDQNDTKEKTERCFFQVVVRDRAGRELAPLSATIEAWSGGNRMETTTLDAAALVERRGVSFKKNAGLDEVFDLRHHLTQPEALHIDRLHYRLEVGVPGASKPGGAKVGGGKVVKEIDIPLAVYVQHVKLNFPFRGQFVVVNGNVTEGGHHEWSQSFAYDIIGTGANLEWFRGKGTRNEDFIGWGRTVLAPAAGVVTYSRNDVPDNPAPGTIDAARLQALPEPLWAVAGNSVVIDHGGGEYSLLAHMQRGSVKVKKGDRVAQGDAIGLLGNSGHSQGPHLHYHLMAGPDLFKCDGLPSRFENVEGGTPAQGLNLEATGGPTPEP